MDLSLSTAAKEVKSSCFETLVCFTVKKELRLSSQTSLL